MNAVDAARPRHSPQSPPPVPPVVPTVDTLRRLVKRRDQLEQTITREIDRLAEAGVGWPQIAAALGVSRQAARQAAMRRRPSFQTTPAPRGSRGVDNSGTEVGESFGLAHDERLLSAWVGRKGEYAVKINKGETHLSHETERPV